AYAQNGTATQYKQLISFIDSHDLSVPENYAYVINQIDVDEYLNYIITEIYSANTDWPAGNNKYWREQGEGHKWRWILYDTDLSFGAHGRGQYNTNTLDSLMHSDGSYYALPLWSTKLTRKMMENETFRNEFIQRFAAHLSTTFKADRVTGVIDSLQTMLAPEIPRHKARWPKSMSLGNTANPSWESLIGIVRTFAMNRPQYMMVFINDEFDLDGAATLNVSANDPAAGKILVSGVEIPSQDFHGRFFKNIPLRCEAFPNPGYRFVRWEGLSTETTDSINVTMTDSDTLTAIFEVDTEPYAGIAINEVMAINQTNITDEFGAHEDWIELYNSRDQSVNIGGLWITDNLNTPGIWQIPATAPDSTTIPSHGFLLLWADKEPGQGILHVNIKLSAEGEQIGLAQKTDSGFVFVDSLTFGAQTADVSLCRYPDGESNIEFSSEPTPKTKNVCQSAIGGEKYQIPDRFALKSIYPNPFNPRTTIRFDLPKEVFVTLTVYDLTGKEVTNLVRRKMSAGYHSVVFDASGLPSTIYICVLRAGNETQVRKMLLLK
ncbi:MAG: CotH kinase family protein, partial [Candidatus Neomarinimicrobiota bacterium]